MTVASLCSFAFCANTRERISAMPPAWVGTITRIGWSGKPWPRARCVLHNVELGRKRRCGQSERHGAGDQDLTKHQCLLWWHSPRPNALRPSPFPVSTICRNDFNEFHERAFMTTIAESDSLAARGIRRLLSNPVCIPRRTFAARVLTVPGLQETT